MKPSRSSVPKGFDFGSDDVLCAYTEYDSSVNHHQPYPSPPPPPPPPPHKPEVREYASGRPLSGNTYYDGGYNSEVIFTVEKAMKKYSSNLFSFLEGISGRLSQLELLCGTIEQDINEFHSDLAHKHNDENLKFIDLVKHLQEVQRSVQIMRDKQELADTQEELSKLQLVQKEYPDTKHTDAKTEAAISTPEVTKVENVPDPRNSAPQARSVTGYTLLPNQSATIGSLPSSSAVQNIPYKQESFQSSTSSTLPPAMSLVEFQRQASTSQQPYQYNQMNNNIPYHAHHSYQTKHEPEPCGIQNPQTAHLYQNESSSLPLPYHPQQQQSWVPTSRQPQYSRPQEKAEIRTEMTPVPSVPFYSYHVPTAQRTAVVSSQQMFPNQLVPQSSEVPQPSPGSQVEERSGRGNYGGYRYPNPGASNYQQPQQMLSPPFPQANPNEINRAPHHLSSTYSHDVPKVVYDADLSRHPYSHYYQQQNRQ